MNARKFIAYNFKQFETAQVAMSQCGMSALNVGITLSLPKDMSDEEVEEVEKHFKGLMWQPITSKADDGARFITVFLHGRP